MTPEASSPLSERAFNHEWEETHMHTLYPSYLDTIDALATAFWLGAMDAMETGREIIDCAPIDHDDQLEADRLWAEYRFLSEATVALERAGALVTDDMGFSPNLTNMSDQVLVHRLDVAAHANDEITMALLKETNRRDISLACRRDGRLYINHEPLPF
jgi:uncharacterized protein YihD (DUF1040 family)